MIVLSDIIQEALYKKRNEHAEAMEEVVCLKEALEQKAVSNENSWAYERHDSVFILTCILIAVGVKIKDRSLSLNSELWHFSNSVIEWLWSSCIPSSSVKYASSKGI